MTRKEKADLAKAFDLLKSDADGAWDAGARIINQMLGRSNRIRDMLDGPMVEIGSVRPSEKFICPTPNRTEEGEKR